MDRRQFLRGGFRKTADVVLTGAEHLALQKARNWLRPPFAVGELEFLAKCTRCDACTVACPHDVIFPLSQTHGVGVEGTPALDLLNKGCHLCSDWPCVNACETGALEKLAQDTEKSADPRESEPRVLDCENRLSDVSIDPTECLPYLGPECGACRDSCPVSALTWHGTRPVIDQDRCVGCALCREACITDPNSIILKKAEFVGDLQ
jgi:ferredoxin-type protein NapF